MKIEIYRRRGLRGPRWYFRIRARNGRVIAQSEGYRNREDAWQTVRLLLTELGDAVPEEL